jgi:hypothetical protein
LRKVPQAMTEVLRQGIVAKTPDVVLSGDVEFDELYVVAGHKSNPEAVLSKGREGWRNRLKGAAVAAPWKRRSRRSSA